MKKQTARVYVKPPIGHITLGDFVKKITGVGFSYSDKISTGWKCKAFIGGLETTKATQSMVELIRKTPGVTSADIKYRGVLSLIVKVSQPAATIFLPYSTNK